MRVCCDEAGSWIKDEREKGASECVSERVSESVSY